ncbi:MAG: LptA/OstA family protein [bacterium]|nr:LptA/OstA family protein [bacterium]MDT8394914.1 LptA/OstA family protein [bacterium]
MRYLKVSRLFSALFLLLFLTIPAWSANGGVEVASDNLRLEERSGIVNFEGNVHVRLTDAALTCDLLTVRTSKDDPSTVRAGEASGNVVLQRGGDRVEAGKAAFDLEKGTVELTGSPRLVRTGSTITAGRITYSLEDGTASFEGPVNAVFTSPGDR